MKKLTEQDKQYAKFKWEFLRRNPEYVADWKELQELMKANHDNWSPTKQPIDDPLEEEANFCKKWNLVSPLHPEICYFDFCYTEANEARLFLNLFYLAKPPIKIINEDIENLEGLYEKLMRNRLPKNFVEKGLIQIEVDLNYTKTRLCKDFELLINEWKETYERKFKESIFDKQAEEYGVHSIKFEKLEVSNDEFDKAIKERNLESLVELLRKKCSLKENTRYPEIDALFEEEMNNRRELYQSKNHFDNFDMYLQVWDLREKEKLTWKEIGNKLFPKIENKVQTARNYHKAVRTIFQKGIDLYVN